MKRPLSIANLIMVMFVTLAVCFSGVYFIRHGLLTVRVAFAEEQLGVFRDMVAKAKGGSQEDCLESLQQTVSYYPSGTKQRKGTKLDTMVEQARQVFDVLLLPHLLYPWPDRSHPAQSMQEENP